MSLRDWEARVLAAEGAAERVAEIEDKLRLASGLTALRERMGVSQTELAERIGVSQPRVAAIERSSNITLDLLERYVSALLPGGGLEIVAVHGHERFPLLVQPHAAVPADTANGTRRRPAAAAARQRTRRQASTARSAASTRRRS
jgi:transcriptional regulator with XRE-family HTH domain